MKLLLDANGHVVVRNGCPVYVRDNGQEIEVDAPKAFEKIQTLTGEASTARIAKEAAETQVAAYKTALGDVLPEDAKKALETVSALGAEQLYTAGKVNEIKAAAQQASDNTMREERRVTGEKIKALETELGNTTGTLNNYMIGTHFDQSKYLGAAVKHQPRSVMKALLAPNFKVESGKPVAYRRPGDDTSKVYSNRKPGEVADFDEAAEILLSEHPDKEQILSAPGGSGSGAQGTNRFKPNGIDPSLPPEQRIAMARAQQAGGT